MSPIHVRGAHTPQNSNNTYLFGHASGRGGGVCVGGVNAAMAAANLSSLSTGGGGVTHTKKNHDSTLLHAKGLGREAEGGGEGEAVGEKEEMGKVGWAGGGAGSNTKVFDTSQDTHTDTHTHTHTHHRQSVTQYLHQRELFLSHTRARAHTHGGHRVFERLVSLWTACHSCCMFPYPSPNRGVPSAIFVTAYSYTRGNGVLQLVAVCCSVLQRVAACCSVLQCVCSFIPAHFPIHKAHVNAH